MKVKVNDTTYLDVLDDSRDYVNYNNKISCLHVDCSLSEIECSDCIFCNKILLNLDELTIEE